MKKKTIIITSFIACLLVLVLGVGTIMKEGTGVNQFTFVQKVSVVNGVAEPEMDSMNFTVEEDGSYILNMEWEAKQSGLLTGINIVDGQGESIFACTADTARLETKLIELAAGEYVWEVYYISSNDRWEWFLEKTNLSPTKETFEFADSGEWRMKYHVSLSEEGNFSNVILVGITVMVALLIVVIMLAATKKGDIIKGDYDERQEVVRGKGFQYGFFTILICNMVLITLDAMGVTLFREMAVAMCISILIGIAVMATYCIWNDGYFALNENKKSLMIFFTFIGVINLFVGAVNICEGSFIKYGSLTFRSINLWCGILFIEIFLAMFLKKIKDGKEE